MPHQTPRPRDRTETAKARKRPASRPLTRANPAKHLVGCSNWPIVRAYIPAEDCWKSTGYGTAGIVRQQPDGKLASAFFVIGLARGGLIQVFGHVDSNWEEIERDLRQQRHKLPPVVVGDQALAARFIWGAYAWSLEEELIWPEEMERSHLVLVPPLPGSRMRWLGQFAGPTGLVPQDLYDVVKSIELADHADEREDLIFTEITYNLVDQAKVLEGLRANGPHILPMDQDLDTVYFECTREFNPKKIMPLEPVRSRQTVGAIRLQGGKLLAEARTLSLAAYLIAKLRESVGDYLVFERASWTEMDAWLTNPEKDNPSAAY